MNTTFDVDEKYIEKEIAWMELGVAAQGSIEAGSDQQERLQELTERLGRGEFHVDIEWDHELKMLIARCVDGRIPETGANPLAPNAAGGTESIFVADDLTTKRYGGKDGSTLAGYQNVVAALASHGYVIGGHTDSHANNEKSGCGANDKLALIYQYIAENGNVLRELTEKLGISVSNKTHDLIVRNAPSRTEFSKGSELLSVLKEKAKKEFVDELDGDHHEVIVAINKRPNTTLDRDALALEFGPKYEAFNVDAWAFEEAARVTSLSDEEVEQKVVAMAYYNLATALVLSGKTMRVVALE